jgi:hypothetical protein
VSTVVFVLATANLILTTPTGLQRVISYVHDDLHAQVLVDSDGVMAFLWHPPPGTTQVTLSTK